MGQKALNHAAEQEDAFTGKMNLIDVHFDTRSTRETRAAFIGSNERMMAPALNPCNAVDLIAQMQSVRKVVKAENLLKRVFTSINQREIVQ